MRENLLVSLQLLHDRYHGSGDWPPAPARVFQSFVAAAARGRNLSPSSVRALEWLEAQAAPTIAAPHMQEGKPVLFYVPNNDLDAVGGDPGRVAELRVGKLVEPRLLAPGVPLLYVWSFEVTADSEARVAELLPIVADLYQLGRGWDAAFARAEVLSDEEVAVRLAYHPGVVHRPTPGGTGTLVLACPQQNSLTSLRARFIAFGRRFAIHGTKRQQSVLFTQPPKARFAEVSYDSPFTSCLFELRNAERPSEFALWQAHRAHDLIVALRDRVAARLSSAFNDRQSEVEATIIGRNRDSREMARVRFVPIPSIGHEHVDRGIRRVLVQIPTAAVFAAEDVRWAVSGLGDGPLDGYLIVPATDDDMLEHYGARARAAHRAWQSVTAVVLPETAQRRRIEPSRKVDEAKAGTERLEEEAHARAAVRQALRHAGVNAKAVSVSVQREPFDRRGKRAEAFAEDTRFAKERLWHVRFELARPVAGPLVVGDGRYLGLGVMQPIRDASRTEGIWTLVIDGDFARTPSIDGLTRALRRAFMARAQAEIGAGETLPQYFSGHEVEGEPAMSGHEHLAFAFDPSERRFWIIAPHRLVHRSARPDEYQHLDTVRRALSDFVELTAGDAGVLRLRQVPMDSQERLLRRRRAWESVTPYVVTRHRKGCSAHDALVADVRAECAGMGLPDVQVEVTEAVGRRGVGLTGMLRLRFNHWIHGPLLLGRAKHFGGGLFASQQD